MDPFAGVAGHQPALRHLASQLESGRLADAYLFVGEPGLGKTEVARRLAQALLPELSLARHPDYWEDDRTQALKLDELRLLPDRLEFHQQSLQQFLSLKPGVAGRRVAMISNFGRLADQSQGILLKTLEEPHPNQVLILTTPSLSPFVVLASLRPGDGGTGPVRPRRLAAPPAAADARRRTARALGPSAGALLRHRRAPGAERQPAACS